MNLPANIDSARLPATYEAARVALSECVRVDECQEWADKAAALASYARQADDTTLEAYAKRIRGRAVRRAGELLKMVEPAHGANQNIRGDASPNVLSRKQAATEAGMSPDQAKQAIRVANVPDEDFEAQIESDTPPTVTALAKQGTKKRPIVDLGERDPKEFNRALHFIGDLEFAVKTLEALDVERITPTLTDTERAKVRRAIEKIDALADRIITRLA